MAMTSKGCGQQRTGRIIGRPVDVISGLISNTNTQFPCDYYSGGGMDIQLATHITVTPAEQKLSQRICG